MKRLLSTVLLTCASALLLCQCDDKGAAIRIKGLRDEIDEINHQNSKIEDERRRLETQIDSIKADKAKLEQDKARVEADQQATEKRLQDLKAEFERYKVQYKLSMKKRAPGMKIDNFTTVEGKAYTNISLKEITDTGIYFQHDGGLMRLQAKQLQPSLQAVLGLLTDLPDIQSASTSKLTPRELALHNRADRDIGIDTASKHVLELRKQLANLLETTQKTKDSIRQGEEEGKKPDTLKRLLGNQQLEAAKLENMILQAEVEAHRLRSTPIPALPSR